MLNIISHKGNQNRTPMQYVPIRMAKVKKTDHTKQWQACGETELKTHDTGGNTNWYNDQ